jgi:8-oxo-dGTP diphosphatase
VVVASPPFGSPAAVIDRLERIHLCTGILERDGAILLVASRYPNRREPLWNLPGGRQQKGELLPGALRREFREETALDVRTLDLAFISESYDGATHFTNTTFLVEAEGEAYLPEIDAHVVALEWVPRSELGSRIAVRVVREPLLGYLNGERQGYYGYAEAGISIEFAD